MDKKSFTLIELMIVVIIVGVLAAVAAPMMRNSINQAIRAEAIAGIGTIKTAERVYYTEYGTYLTIVFPPDSARDNQFQALGMKTTDLDCVYFSNNCYYGSVQSMICYANWSTAPRANRVQNWNLINMNFINGVITIDFSY